MTKENGSIVVECTLPGLGLAKGTRTLAEVMSGAAAAPPPDAPAVETRAVDAKPAGPASKPVRPVGPNSAK